MLGRFLQALLGSKSARTVRKLEPIVRRINELEHTVTPLTDEQLAQKTISFREKIAHGASLDDLLPEAFATVREAARRQLGQRHFESSSWAVSYCIKVKLLK